MNVIHTTVTAHNSVELADQINAAFEGGAITVVNGREIVSVWGKAPAVAWQNGTVSVTVKGRSKGKVGTVYVKLGFTVHAV